MILLIDAGNTRLKMAVLDGDGPGPMATVVSAPLDESGLATALAGLPAVEAVRGVSVLDDERCGMLAAALELAGLPRLELLTTPAGSDGLRCGYRDPSQMGADRWFALVGAATFLGRGVPFSLLTAGTAITLDRVDEDGVHRGGLILPGLTMARRTLYRDTGRLPAVEDGETHLLGRSTEDAIRSGQAAAAAALGERAAAAGRVLVTGGDAGRILALSDRLEPAPEDLVLRGLASSEMLRS